MRDLLEPRVQMGGHLHPWLWSFCRY